MQNYSDKKTIFGMALFALSILMLIYMLINPLNQLIFNVEEYFTLTLVNFPIADIITMTGSDINPPLYYLLLKAVSKFTGDMFMMKLISIIPYAILLIVSAVKLREDYGWFTAGLFAFAIAAAGGFFTSFIALRPYSWALLFVVLSFIFLRDIIVKNDKVSWILFTACSVLSAYTYYFAGITSICLYLILLAYVLNENRDSLKMWGISLAALVICYVPWILPLANLLNSIHNSFWVPAPTADVIIQSLAYFAYSGDTLLSIVAILIVAAITFLYLQTKDKEQNYVLSGIGAFILTLIIGIIISFAFKPVLLARCMLPAAGLVWLSVSIMLSKLEDRTFLISFALIALILISGIGFIISESGDLATSAMSQKDALDKITEDGNATVILTTPNMIVHFLDYADEWDLQCIKTEYIYGENMARAHQLFDFKDITLDEIKNLTGDKNVYLISWGAPDSDLNTTTLSSENGIVISQLNIPKAEEEYY